MPRSIAHIPPGEGRSLRVLGEQVTCKTTSERTGGAYSLFEVASQPGAGPPPHIQHREEEAFWVLQGRYEFLVGGRALTASARSLIYIPRGTLHSHKNVGEGLGRMLVSQTPGGLYERFFEEVGRPVVGEAGPGFFEELPDAESIAATAARYGIEIAPPLLERAQPDDASRAAAP
jgi:quercetin dioxygenase-like cupin family protein